MLYVILGFIIGAILSGLFFVRKTHQKELWIEREINRGIAQREQEVLQELKDQQERILNEERSKMFSQSQERIEKQEEKAEEDLVKYLTEKQKRLEKEIEEGVNFHLKKGDEIKTKLNAEIEDLKTALAVLKSAQNAYNAEVLRRKEILEGEDFYRIILSDEDIADIENLKKVEKLLHNKEILNKLIYSTYLQKPLRELTNRVLENRKVSGIYKITYVKTGEAYIGRSVDVKNRWQEHVKSSLSIGTIASSFLHVKMAKEGIHNFSFELLEEVEKDKLSEREKYYISFYETTKQLNVKEG